jgi:glucokinase
MTNVILALDVGGTKALGGLVTVTGAVLSTCELPTGGVPGRIDPGLSVVRRLAEQLLEEVSAHGDLQLTAVGAGFPEYVGNGLLRSREVLDWTDQPGDVLRRLVGDDIPITVESDARCGALAEAQLGAGRQSNLVAYMSWGTGLSWTLVQNGVALAGKRGEAIGFGELAVPARVSTDWIGNLEQFASGKGIATRYSAATGEDVGETREVITRAMQGETAATAVLDSAAQAIGESLASMVSLVDPELVILGGGIGVSDTSLRRSAGVHYASAVASRPDSPPLVNGELGPHSGLLGAAVITGHLALPL